MKKNMMFVLMAMLTVTCIFSYDFSSDFAYLEKTALSCQAEYAFYEEMYDMNSTVTFADAVVLPSQVIDWSRLKYDYDVPVAVLYLKMNDYYAANGMYDFKLDFIRISGKNAQNIYILDELASIFMLTNSFMINVSDYDCEIIGSDESYIFFVYSPVNATEDFVINISVDSITENWIIRKSSRDFRTAQKIASEN